MAPLIEVCVEGLEGARIAIDAGADRIELNSSLKLDGLTPSIEDVQAVKLLASVPVITMLRPHAHGFVYDQPTQLSMLRDLERLLAEGVDGVAVGGLTETGEIDVGFMAELRRYTEGRDLVMHRAFDALRDQAHGLEQLIDMGVDRVLTSGGAPTAEAGVEELRKLIFQASGRIEILPGAGIRPSNAFQIVEQTKCEQLHGTFKQNRHDRILPDPKAIADLKKLF